jgi:hypothetical protein
MSLNAVRYAATESAASAARSLAVNGHPHSFQSFETYYALLVIQTLLLVFVPHTYLC